MSYKCSGTIFKSNSLQSLTHWKKKRDSNVDEKQNEDKDNDANKKKDDGGDNDTD